MIFAINSQNAFISWSPLMTKNHIVKHHLIGFLEGWLARDQVNDFIGDSEYPTQCGESDHVIIRKAPPQSVIVLL